MKFRGTRRLIALYICKLSEYCRARMIGRKYTNTSVVCSVPAKYRTISLCRMRLGGGERLCGTQRFAILPRERVDV